MVRQFRTVSRQFRLVFAAVPDGVPGIVSDAGVRDTADLI
jgi:hypothetical protein